MRYAQERNLCKTARELCADAAASNSLSNSDNIAQHANTCKARREALLPIVEARLVSATWTLRRMPDRERGFLHMRGSLWPEMQSEQGCYPKNQLTVFNTRRQASLSPKEIDQMQPTLDLLSMLPDISDRQIVFWAAWHQDGELQSRIPWAKVRNSLGVNTSRWTLKRHYQGSLDWLVALLELQK